MIEQGLGKFVDADFIRTTSREMQEAMDMTQEEMDLAAHHLLMLSDDGVPQAAAQVPQPSNPGAAVRSGGNQPLTLALSTAFSEVDEVRPPPRRNKS